MAEGAPDLSTVQQRNCCCSSFPDFAAVCLFIEQFGELLGLHPLDINNLKEGFEDKSDEVSDLIQGLHIYLLRRIKKNVPSDRWERELAKFCLSYSQWDCWELEERGYAKLKLQTRLSIIRNLLEAQFENNLKFQEKLRTEVAEEDLRQQCYGRDKSGLCYWYIQDEFLTVNVYQVEQDDTDGASWQIVAKDRDELAVLIECLKENKPIPCVLAQQPPRSDTPLSMMSSVGGAGLGQSRTATPTKFAFDRSTPVKSQLAAVECADKTAKAQHAECVGESEVKPDMAALNCTVKQESPADDVKDTSTDVKLDEVKQEQDVAVSEGGDESNCAAGESTDQGVSSKDTAEETEDITDNKQESDEGEMVDCKLPFTSSATDLSIMSVASDQTPVEKETTPCLGSETDSEDNMPLSQLKKSCVLMSQTRRSLMKAKRKHDKKKWKEMVKKKKLRQQKGGKAADSAVDSPKSSQRASGRQRKPVFHGLQTEEVDSDSLSDDDYIPSQGRNARRQAKLFQALIHTRKDELSSEVDNDDTPCTSCGKYNQPHLMLLCDKCDAGWHTGCVKPRLFYIPDDEFHCPNCEQTMLIAKLEGDLEKLDEQIKARDSKLKRQERQEKYALSNGINPSNIISDRGSWTERAPRDRKLKKFDEYAYDSEDDYNEAPVRRPSRNKAKVNYTFEQYEAVMNNAIGKKTTGDPTILAGVNSSLVPSSKSTARGRPPPGQSRGKDISNLFDGANLSIMSDEENEGEMNSSRDEQQMARGKEEQQMARGKEEQQMARGKENEDVNSSLNAVDSQRNRKRPSKFNDMDADSAGEEDADYRMSDEQNDDDGPSGDSEEEFSDDWTPGGRSARKAGKGRRRGLREPRDNVRDFICDEEESETEKRKPKRSYQRSTRTSAATQAALRMRNKRPAKFGFTSSEESLATTPCSSSTEEEEHVAKRKLNKWNKIKTYSSSRDTAQSKKGPSKKKKRRQVKKDYNSDESTEESSGSEEEYKPVGEEEAAASAAEAETEGEGSEDGVRRVNNRLDSSSDEEKQSDVEAAEKKKSIEEATPVVKSEESQSAPTNTSDKQSSNDIDMQTVSVNGTSRVCESETTADTDTGVTQSSSTRNGESKDIQTSKDDVIDIPATNDMKCVQTNVKTPADTEVKSGSEKEVVTSSSIDSKSAVSPAKLPDLSEGNSLKPLNPTAPHPSMLLHKSLPHEKSATQGKLSLHASQGSAVSSPTGNTNNSNSAPTQFPVSCPQATYPVLPPYKPSPHYPPYRTPYPYASFTHAQPELQGNAPPLPHAAMQMSGGSSSPHSAPNGQLYYHPMPQQYPIQNYPQEQYARGMERSNSYMMPYNQHRPSIGEPTLTPMANQPANHSSNTFMVDNLLQSSQNAVNYNTTSDMPEDDDEMSSYMTLANSIASGGTDNT